VRHIHVKYDGLGFILLNELIKEETARLWSRRFLLKTQGFHHFLILLFYSHPAFGLLPFCAFYD